MRDAHPPRTLSVRGWELTLAHRLDGPDLDAAGALLRAVVRADGHRGVGAGALEVLGGQVHHTALAVLARDPDAPRPALAGLAFGQVVDPPAWTVELTVHPDRRSRGLGGALLDAVLDAAPPGSSPQVWAYRPGPTQERLAARHGLVPLRHLNHLRGPTSAAHPPERLGGGLRLRVLDPDRDLAELVALHNAAFTYERLDLETVRVRLARPYMGPDHLLVAQAPDGRLAGYVWMSSPRPDGEGEGAGELVLLAVHPDWQGHHLGQALTAAGLDLLARRGVDRCTLYMDAANTPAARVYERNGFTLHHTDVLYGRPDSVAPAGGLAGSADAESSGGASVRGSNP